MAWDEHHLSVRFTLLDNQLVDADDRPLCRIDHLELDLDADGARVVAMLVGMQALGSRLGGAIGRAMAAGAARLRAGADDSRPPTIGMELLDSLQPLVKLSLSLAELPHIAGLERWLARHFIGPLPGAGDADE